MHFSHSILLVVVATFQLANSQEYTMPPPPQLLLRGRQNDPAQLTSHDRQLQVGGPFGPWNIDFLNFTADFSVGSVDELELKYSIGKNRVYNTNLLAKDCKSEITGINITLSDYIQEDLLSLSYSIDKSAITASNIWNNDLSKLELCQVVQLILPANANTNTPMMVITEDKRIFDIDFDLSVDFSFNNGVRGGTIENETISTNVTSYVQYCKCGGPQDFTCNEDNLGPNDDLFLCLKSASSEVEIDILNSMDLTQGGTTLPVIQANAVSLPSITSRDYVPAQNGVVVTTRVPSNLFNFTLGESISVTGEVEMKLAGSGRRLQGNIDGSKVSGDELTSSFNLKVSLQTERVHHEDDLAANSAKAIASAGLAIFCASLAFVCAI